MGQIRIDGFAATANPADYVPRVSTERALAGLAEAIEEGAGVAAALLGPPGFGKTLLLRLLGCRLAERLHPVYVPYPALPPGELLTLALGLMNAPCGADPRRRVLEIARELRAAGSGLLLLVDDAEVMPPATALAAAELANESGGGLRLVLALQEGERARDLLDALGAYALGVPLREPMTREETSDYVRRRLARLALAGAPPAEPSERALAAIFRASEGVPRGVHHAAQALLAIPDGV